MNEDIWQALKEERQEWIRKGSYLSEEAQKLLEESADCFAEADKIRQKMKRILDETGKEETSDWE